MKEKSVVAFGTFDGLHIGHMSVLNTALAFENINHVVVTFKEPPKRKNSSESVGMLMTGTEKIRRFKSMGFDKMEVLDYDDVCNMSPEEYLEWIFEKYNVSVAVCGFDHRFGKGGAGDAKFLTEFCKTRGAKAIVCSPVDLFGQTVSSSLIRKLITDGEVEKANELLGYFFSLKSEVLHGDQRGRTLGFPTANQLLDQNVIVPKYGVYATAVTIDNKVYSGVTNIGIRPCFELEIAQSETYINGFSGNLYGLKLEVKLLKYLREETLFKNIEQLKKAIAKDQESAEKVFKEKFK